MRIRNRLVPCLSLLLAACGIDTSAEDEGEVDVYLDAEETIAEGLEAGTGPENLVDGWSVTYDKFVVAVGGFRAGRSGEPDATLDAPEVHVVDLALLATTGFPIARFEGVKAGRWNRVSYETPAATASATRDETVEPADFDAMVAGGYSHLVEGSATKGDTTLALSWRLSAPTRLTDCGPEEGDLGFAVPAGGAAEVELTLHGDHWFFDAFPSATENVERRAAWLPLADANADGRVDTEDLAATPASAALSSSEYSLAGSPIPITTLLDWVTAQAHGLGHLQGEGDCVRTPGG